MRFANCEIRPEAREVLVDGVIQSVTPLTLDLLLYLVRNRHRVVSKDELIQRVWHGRVVSDGVVARVVMKARRTIDDDANNPSFIKTFNRKGYRFVGLLQPQDSRENEADLPIQADVSATRDKDGTRGIRVAVLPFVNATGDARLSWLELGLMGVLIKELEHESEVALVPAASVLAAIDQTTERRVSARDASLAKLLGADFIVSARVHALQGNYVADCSFYRDAPLPPKRIECEELSELPQRLAREAFEILFPGQTPQSSPRGPSDDPFVQQVWARAMQSSLEEHWELAANLFQVVTSIDPGNMDSRLQHARTLAYIKPTEALGLVEKIREEADARLTVGQRFECLATTARCLDITGSVSAAKSAWSEALDLADETLGPDCLIASHMGLAHSALAESDLAAASVHLNQVERLCRTSGNQIGLLAALSDLGMVEALEGNLFAARALFEESLELSKGSRRAVHPLYTALYLATVNAELGYFSRAMELAQQTFARAKRHSRPSVVIALGGALCEIAWHQGDGEIIRSTLGDMERLSDEGHFVASWSLYLARGLLAASERDYEAASQLLTQGLRLLVEKGQFRQIDEILPFLQICTSRLESGSAALEAAALLSQQSGVITMPLSAAVALHGKVVEAVRREDYGQAISFLEHSIESIAPSFWRARSALDLAWLLTEEGRVAAAESVVRSLRPWLKEHPSGMIVDARMHLATGRHEEALRVLGCCPARLRERARAVLHRLEEAGRGGTTSGSGQRLAPGWLPSDPI